MLQHSTALVSFTGANLVNEGLTDFLHHLRDHADPLAVYLLDTLPGTLRTRFREAQLPEPGAYAPQPIRTLALDLFNTWLDADDLHRHPMIEPVKDEPIVMLLYEQRPDETERRFSTWRRRLNRLLLARVFPETLTLTRYYLALDLGSESAAAYLRSAFDPTRSTISLQAHAERLLPDALGRIDFLYDGALTEATPLQSSRLRNRFSVEDDRQPYPLDPDHPMLDLFDPADRDRTIFGLFQRRDTALALNLLPNPKILFQSNGAALIPRVRFLGSDGDGSPLAPHEVLFHLTTQIVRNLALRAPEIQQQSLFPEDVHLVLTVPNVYSQVHIEGLRSFVEAYAGVNAVEAIYESDAAAHFALDPGPESSDARTFSRTLNQACHTHGEVYLVTIDVGRGTTDASLIHITQPDPESTDQRRTHRVLGRTGRSDGGNRLSYLFAKYFDREIRRLLLTYDVRGVFDFLTAPNAGFQPGPFQHVAVHEMAALIEIYKRHFDEPLSEALRQKQGRHIVRIIEQIFKTQDIALADVHPNLYKMAGLRPPAPSETPIPGSLDPKDAHALADDLWTLLRWSTFTMAAEAEASASTPPARRSGRPIWNRLLAFLRRVIGLAPHPQLQAPTSASQPSQPPGPFREINAYVEANTVQLLRELKRKALLRTGGHTLPMDRTFVLVAGQASQFVPLRRRLEAQIREQFGLNPQSAHVVFLSNTMAKEACCRGAAAFKSANYALEAEPPINGYYGFEQGGFVLPIDMDRLLSERRVVLEGQVQGHRIFDTTYMLVYSPDPFSNPIQGDGALDAHPAANFDTAPTKPIRPRRSPNHPPRFEIVLEYHNNRPQLVVNGEPIDELTYGDVPHEDTYAKVWPEALKPG